MTRRERVMNALNFLPTDKIPKDLSGMASTGISCFAYKKLIDHLGFERRKIKVWDTGQMLALPDLDVLDYLDCDVVMTDGFVTNAFDQGELWKPYDFNGRLQDGAVVRPESFETRADGTIVQNGNSYMPPSAHVFDTEHAGNPFNLNDDFVKEDLGELEARVMKRVISDEDVSRIVEHCKKVRASTDRAVMFDGLNSGIGLRTGIVQYSMMCLLEPDYIEESHRIINNASLARYEKLVPAIAPYVDIILIAADDMGTQNDLILPPEAYQRLYFPFYKQLNDVVHKTAPGVKTFLHSCGAIYSLIDQIAHAGFDILNPVQWSAGRQDYRQWKDKARKKISFWGGGVNSQTTLPLGTVEQVSAEVSEVCEYLKQDGGFVFCNIHNILAEIAPEKVTAMYKAASL